MESVSALEFSFADNADFKLTEVQSTKKYNIDGENAGSFFLQTNLFFWKI